MNSKDVKQLREALPRACKLKVTETKDLKGCVEVQTVFMSWDNQPFRFFAYRRPGSQKIYLTDAGGFLKHLTRAEQPVKMLLLQRLMFGYGLTVLEDGQVLEQTDLPLWERLASMFQAWAGLDGVVRTWNLAQGQRS